MTDSTETESKTTNLNRFIKFKKIGEGSYGIVHIVQEKSTTKSYAAKILNLTKLKGETPEEKMRSVAIEVNNHAKFKHPSIVEFIGFSKTDFANEKNPVIITEYVPNGTLADWITNEQKGMPNELWNKTRKLIIIYCVASAMAYLHKNNFIHRDLKPENILIDDLLIPKIADFGLSKIISESSTSSKTTKMGQNKGTPMYMAPEIWYNNIYSEAGDVYAFGIILYELITNKKPYEDMSLFALVNKVCNGGRPDIPSDTSEVYQQLIKRCWDDAPSKRPSFEDILIELKEDPSYFSGSDIDKELFKSVAKSIDQYETSFDKDRNIINIKDLLEPITESIKFTKPIEDTDSTIEVKSGKKSKQEQIESIFLEGFYYEKGLNGCPVNQKKANERYEKAAKKGHINACFKMGEILEKGYSHEVDIKKAAFYYKKAAEQGDYDSMDRYALIMKNQNENLDEACEYFRRAAEEGENMNAMYHYAIMLEEGLGVTQNLEKAAKKCKIAADNDQIEAIKHYASMLSEGKGVAANEEEANKYIRIGATKNDLDMINQYAQILKFGGKGIKANKREAFRLLKWAAEKGHTDSMINYSEMLKEGGEGVGKPDKINAINVMKNAADKGNTKAMHKYALMKEKGEDGTIDMKECCKYLKKASDADYPESMIHYAYILKEGLNGYKKDIRQALKYYKKAAETGNTAGMYSYAEMNEKGCDGIEPNEEEALKYYKKAADKNHYISAYAYAVLLNKIDSKGNLKEALNYMKKASDGGYPHAKLQYAIFLMEEDKPAAIKYFEELAKEGNGEAMNYYGLMLKNGTGIVTKKLKAMEYFEKAANTGNVDGMFNYAIMLEEDAKNIAKSNPIESEKLMAKAIAYFKNAADKGNVESMNQYALLLKKDDKYKISEAIEYFQKAEENGHPEAINNLNIMLQNVDTKYIDDSKLLNLYKYRADEKSDRDAMYMVGLLLEKKFEDPTEEEKRMIFKYYEKAASKDHADANYKLGMMYKQGFGVALNSNTALMYLKKATKLGSASGQFNLGLIQKEKPSQRNEGITNIIAAAEANCPEAMCYYARMLEKGDCVKKDEEEANKYYNKAIKKGNVEAKYHYGLLIEKKEGSKKALNYFEKAAEEGHIESILKCVSLYEGDFSSTVNQKKSIQFLKKAADKGDINSMYKYASIKEKGKKGVPEDLGEACLYYKKAADKGNVDCMVKYASIKEKGKKSEKRESIKYLKEAADKGNASALLRYAQIMRDGIDGVVPQNQTEAKKYFEKAVNKQNVTAMHEYARFLLEIDRIRNKEKAKKLFCDAIGRDKTNYDLKFEYAEFLHNNLGEKKTASEYYKDAADHGHINAKYHYACILFNGDGVGKNQSKALNYYKEAADKDNVDAMYEYAGIMKKGSEDVDPNKDEALKYYEKVAIKSKAEIKYDAMYQYASIVIAENKKKKPIPKVDSNSNLRKAIDYLREASNHDNIESMYQYAKILKKGLFGVQVDKKKAADLFKKAAGDDKMNGSPKAMRHYASLAENEKIAFKYIQNAAQKNDIKAAPIYAQLCLKNGDKEEAAKYYKISADSENGPAESMNIYAEILESYDDETKYDEVFKYYEKAADIKLRHAKGIFNYARVLENGIGCEIDKEKAYENYCEAAKLNYQPAIYRKALKLSIGEGCDENKAEAINIFKNLADNGYNEAKVKYKELVSNKPMLKDNDAESIFRYAYRLYHVDGDKPQALNYFKVAADKDHVAAMNNYAMMLLQGDGVTQNVEQGLSYLIKAVDKRHADSLFNYATMLEKGINVEKNIDEAIVYYKMAADRCHPQAMNNYAMVLKSRTNSESIIKEVCLLLINAANLGNNDASYNYGMMLLRGDKVKANQKKAFTYIKQAALKNDRDAMYVYAWMLHVGAGCRINKKLAFEFYKKAADKGHKAAMNNYGMMNQVGDGVPLNKEEAIKYFNKAAEEPEVEGRDYEDAAAVSLDQSKRKQKDAVFNIALMYDNGDGLDVDKYEASRRYKEASDMNQTEAMNNYACLMPDESLEYFKAAAEDGNPIAMFNYGLKLEKEGEIFYACEMFKKAAKAGLPSAMYNYGVMLYKGQGVEKNKQMAAKYFKAAAKKGHKNSIKACNIMKKQGF